MPIQTITQDVKKRTKSLHISLTCQKNDKNLTYPF